jgi:hypothetical protein
MREKIEVLKNRELNFKGILQLGINEAGEYIVRNKFNDKKYTSYTEAAKEFTRLKLAGL